MQEDQFTPFAILLFAIVIAIIGAVEIEILALSSPIARPQITDNSIKIQAATLDEMNTAIKTGPPSDSFRQATEVEISKSFLNSPPAPEKIRAASEEEIQNSASKNVIIH